MFRLIDSAVDPTFDESDVRQWPAVELAPPREKSGVELPSGADPRDVKDPVARAAYEAALRENNKKTLRANFQVALRRVDEASMNSLRIVLTNYRPFTPSDTAVLTTIIQSGGLSSQRIAKIISLI